MKMIIGRFCEMDVDECIDHPHICQNGATCHNVDGGFLCTCVNGWEGRYCERNVDDCASQPCFNGGTCRDGVATFHCECPPGKIGLLCHLDDPCASNPCQSGAICDADPAQGLYVCTCAKGFRGVNCQEDIDECQEGRQILKNFKKIKIFLFKL